MMKQHTLSSALRKGFVSSTLSSALFAAAYTQQPTITWIGVIGSGQNPWSEAFNVTNNRYVVGHSGTNYNNTTHTGNNRAIRWDGNTNTMQDLGTIPGNNSTAWSISADAQYAAGMEFVGSNMRAARFNATTNTKNDPGTFGGTMALGADISSDGRYMVGWATDTTGNGRAYRWDSVTNTLTNLGTLPNHIASAGYGVSDDGNIVAGLSIGGSPSFLFQAVRWVGTSIFSLGSLAGYNESLAWNTSSDGSVIVGKAWTGTQGRAFKWTQATGMQNLGALAGHNWSEAFGISDDGTVILGFSGNPTAAFYANGTPYVAGYLANIAAFRAVIWDQNGVPQDLNVLYASALQNGSILYTAMGISADKRYITGTGFNAATGRIEGYIIDTIPEPASLTALGMGLASLLRLRRRKA